MMPHQARTDGDNCKDFGKVIIGKARQTALGRSAAGLATLCLAWSGPQARRGVVKASAKGAETGQSRCLVGVSRPFRTRGHMA